MSDSKLDEYLQQGVYGIKETKPDERRKFLGTLRERVIIALTQVQVMEEGVYPQFEEALKDNQKAHLFLNGNMDYSYLSKYTMLAQKYKVEFTLVSNKEHDTDIGLVLAYDYAIDKEEIFVTKKILPITEPFLAPKKKQKGVFSVLKKVFSK